jgi:para-aminobenzoate synthetase/4-amino-4-deoxychorismate lyase
MFTVCLRSGDGSIEFSHPHDVLRPTGAPAALEAFDACDRALREGYWVAGYLTYELGAALAGAEHGATAGNVRAESPLLAIGIFDAPVAGVAASGFARLSPLLRGVDRARYESAIRVIRAALYEGEVYQVNYTVPFDCAIEGEPYALWSAIAATTDAAYQAFVQDGEQSILSWSPELFLEFDGTSVVTRPMKGTATLDRIDELHDAKNRAEHVMIVDLLRNDLHRICDRVEVEALCSVERYPTFATMTSTLRGELRAQASLRDIFAALFPCGSITGAPKRAAMATIERLEARPRGAYCGSVGFLAPERRGWWNVAIRTAQSHAGVARFDAGGGIVSDSRAETEYAEIEVKRAFLHPFTSAPELWETLASDAGEATLDAHLARLARSAALFDITYDAAALRAAVPGAPAQPLLVRIRLHADGTWAIRSDPLERPESVTISLSPEVVRSDDPFLRIKSAWRPAHDRAAAFARERGLFDALLVNERGECTEGARTNLFVQIEDRLITPPLACGVLPGILRSRIVSEGEAVERVLTIDDLRRARKVFVGNSARGLLPARVI